MSDIDDYENFESGVGKLIIYLRKRLIVDKNTL